MSYKGSAERVIANRQLASGETLFSTAGSAAACPDVDLEDQIQSHASVETRALQRTKLLEMFLQVSRAVSKAKTSDEAIQATLECIANCNDWMVGHAWRLAGDDTGQLESSMLWHASNGVDWRSQPFNRFCSMRQRTRICPGEGLIGLVLQRGRPQWLSELDGRTRSRDYCNLDVQSVIAFPVTLEGKVVAVMEFLSDRATRPTGGLLDIMADIGVQLGYAIARTRAKRIIAEVTNTERQRVGRELHDGIVQQLTGGALIAESLRRSLPAETNLHERLEQVVQILKQVHRDVRRLSDGLLNTEIRANDLLPALRKLAQETTDRYQLRCKVRHSQFQEGFISVDLAASVILQIVREAVHNAVKHAHAKEILIELASDTSFRLSVSDDGVGIEVAQYTAASSHGLRIMHHRAQSIRGELKTEAIDSGGTRVRLTIPKRSCQHVQYDPRPLISHCSCR